ncbi:MAG: hypothetical protein R2799_04280 [Crocinitomicaceae bacterium]
MKKILLAVGGMILSASLFSQTNQISNTGNIGIGTTNPTKNLEVNGQTRLSGTVEMDSMVIVKDSMIVEKDARIKENLKVEKNVYVLGTSTMIGDFTSQGTSNLEGTTYLNGQTYMTSLSNAPVNQNSLQNGYLLVQGGNGRVFRTPISEFSNIIYNAELGCLSNPNGSTTPQWQASPGQIVMKCHGKLGIGTMSPQFKTQIIGNTHISKSLMVGESPNVHLAKLSVIANENDSKPLMVLGTVNPADQSTLQKKFMVMPSGLVYATEIKVRLASNFPDYVFKNDYKLMSIEAVSEYINENGHLPNMPKAEEIEKEGLSVGEMQVKIVEKVEELTLYIIQLKEENEALKKRIEELEK